MSALVLAFMVASWRSATSGSPRRTVFASSAGSTDDERERRDSARGGACGAGLRHRRGRGRREPEARAAAGDGDVRPRRGHVADERLDLGGRHRPEHDRERGAGGDRAGGARVCRLHPDHEQSWRPDRAQASLRARPARLRDGRGGDDTCPESDGDHRFLGDRRRPGCVASAARDAVSDPRELRGRGTQEGVRARRGRGRDRRRSRPADRRLRHHVPVVAGRLRARGRRDRGRALPDEARP